MPIAGLVDNICALYPVEVTRRVVHSQATMWHKHLYNAASAASALEWFSMFLSPAAVDVSSMEYFVWVAFLTS